jgi:hypothetical protein
VAWTPHTSPLWWHNRKLGDWYKLASNSQGDQGNTCFVRRAGGDARICYLNNWSLREDFIYGAHYELPGHLSHAFNQTLTGIPERGMRSRRPDDAP